MRKKRRKPPQLRLILKLISFDFSGIHTMWFG